MAVPRTWNVLVVGICSAWLLGCEASQERVGNEVVSLRLVQVYGGTEEPESPQRQRGTGGESEGSRSETAFGAVTDVIQAADGQIFVLDGAFRRLVALGPGGSVKWTKDLPEGDGPGEFREPWLLASVPGFRIAIFDQALNRIHYLEDRGKLEAEPLVLRHGGRIADIAFDDSGSPWVVPLLLPESEFAALVFADDGTTHRDAFPRTRRDREYSWGSTSGRLAVSRDGRILYAHGQPGTWTERSDGDGYRRFGEEVFPGVTPVVQGPPQRPRPMVSFPAWVVAIGEMPGGEVAIVYYALAPFMDGEDWVVTPGANESPEVRHFLDLFDSDGAYLGTAQFPSGPATLGWETWSGRVAHIASETGRILIPGHGLTEFVAEFEVVRTQRGS